MWNHENSHKACGGIQYAISLQDKIFSRTGYINTMLQEVADVKHLLNPTAYKIHYAILPLLGHFMVTKASSRAYVLGTHKPCLWEPSCCQVPQTLGKS